MSLVLEMLFEAVLEIVFALLIEPFRTIRRTPRTWCRLSQALLFLGFSAVIVGCVLWAIDNATGSSVFFVGCCFFACGYIAVIAGHLFAPSTEDLLDNAQQETPKPG